MILLTFLTLGRATQDLALRYLFFRANLESFLGKNGKNDGFTKMSVVLRIMKIVHSAAVALIMNLHFLSCFKAEPTSFN